MLSSYVHPDEVRRYLPGSLPTGDGQSHPARARVVYDAIRSIGLTYTPTPVAVGESQLIRSPAEVLVTPRHGNCLDLAVVYSGACLAAGLHPVVVVLHDADGPNHAVVLVFVGGDHGTDVAPPSAWTDDIRTGFATPGEWLPVDATVVASGYPTAGFAASDFEAAVASGASELQRRAWTSVVDIGESGAGIGLQSLAELPNLRSILDPPYATRPEPPDGDREDLGFRLELIRSEFDVLPYQARAEFDRLYDELSNAPANGRLMVRVLTGVGGSGKTRLAAELCAKLSRGQAAGRHWQAGWLPQHVHDERDWSPERLEWLATTLSPLVVAIDYAEGRIAQVGAAIQVLGRRSAGPTVILLTARDAGPWFKDLKGAHKRDADIREVDIAERPSNVERIHRHALTAFAREMNGAYAPPGLLNSNPVTGLDRWTTLDVVMRAWLTAHRGVATTVTTRAELYDEILEHEESLWAKVWRGRHATTALTDPIRAAFAPAAALVSCASPTVDQTLRIVRCAGGEEPERIADVLAVALRSGATGLAVRPDPVADRLVSRELVEQPRLLPALLATTADEPGALGAVFRAIVRATQTMPEAHGPLVGQLAAALPSDKRFWPPAFDVAATHAGAVRDGLATAIRAADTLPINVTRLDELNNQRASLAPLRAAVASRLVSNLTAPTTDASEESRASHAAALLTASVTMSFAGDHRGALDANTRAVDLYTALAADTPDAHRANLAGSLNNLANRRSNLGDHRGALDAITQAVDLYTALAADNPDAHRANLAGSLNNLANMRSDLGDHRGALDAITPAVDLYTALAADNPDAHRANLAMALNNLANMRNSLGDHRGALDAITQAVDLYTALAADNPDAHRADLAMALNNLANMRASLGDDRGALDAITQAVDLYTALAADNPDAHRANLAMALNNLANKRSSLGDHPGALDAITQAVDLYTTLAADNPDAHLPNLALSLNNLANTHSHLGDEAEGIAAFERTAALLAGVGQGYLLARLAERFSKTDDRSAAAEVLLRSARVLDAQYFELSARGGRELVRRVAQHLARSGFDGTALPLWATLPLDDATRELVGEWSAVAQTRSEGRWVRERAKVLGDTGLPDQLSVLAKLYEGNEHIERCVAVLAAIAQYGLEPVAAELQTLGTAADDLREWLATPSWYADEQYLLRYEGALRQASVVQVAAALDAQHAAILVLCDDFDIDRIYDVIREPEHAIGIVAQVIADGDARLLQLLAVASPGLLAMPDLGALLTATAHVLTTDDTVPDDLVDLVAASTAGSNNVALFRSTLTTLGRARPDLTDRLAPLQAALQHHAPEANV